jgi:hypothetical protein
MKKQVIMITMTSLLGSLRGYWRCALTHSLTYLLTHSLTHLLAYLLTHSLTYSLTHLLTHLLTRLLQGQHIIDLIEPSTINSGNGYMEFTSVECPTLACAVQVLSIIRSRAPGVLPSDGSNALGDSDRAHFFLRIVIHRRKTKGNEGMIGGTLSHLHICDLLGIPSLLLTYLLTHSLT